MPSLEGAKKAFRSAVSSKSRFEGATLHTTFSITLDPSSREPHVWAEPVVDHSAALLKRLTDADRAAIQQAVDNAVQKSEIELTASGLYRNTTCTEGILATGQAYDILMRSHLGDVGIKLATNTWAIPELEKYCQCLTCRPTGRSLNTSGVTIVTRQTSGPQSSTHFKSQCYMRTSKDAEPQRQPATSFTPARLESIRKFLEALDDKMDHVVTSITPDKHIEWLRYLGPNSTSDQVYSAVIHQMTNEEPYRSMHHIILDPKDMPDDDCSTWLPREDNKYNYTPVSSVSPSQWSRPTEEA